MIDIEEMTPGEVTDFLTRNNYGHLGCSRDGRPYVVPVHFAFRDPHIYLYTTEGMKTDFISANPQVCLQSEQVQDTQHWHSVIVIGKAERMTSEADRNHALEILRESQDPASTPALARTWTDAWGRQLEEAIYRITPAITSGRKTRG
ncbi:MAG TPA: pyridoxamine 5'-phosphate oxidase family protein [Terriglobales bacterium]|nr:pyridoxamine 5'-phosphate oxidase family protein [Terriglobales bacterium]